MVGWLVLLFVGQTSDPVHLRYSAPDVCPDRAAYTALVMARDETARFDDDADRRIVVSIVTSTRAITGTLVVEEAAHTFAPRRVSGADCDEVSSALALITAMVIAAPPEILPPPSETVTAPPFIESFSRVTEPRPWPKRPRRIHIGAAIDLSATSGIVPGVAMSVPIDVVVGAIDEGASGPSLRLGLSWGVGRTQEKSARFTHLGVGLDVCPVNFAVDAFRIEPCGRATLGVLIARGDTLEPPVTARRPWFAAGLRLRGLWFVTRDVFLELSGELLAPFTRDRFSSRFPEETLYRPPALVAAVQSGVGVVFW